MSGAPLDRVRDFWKPLIDSGELDHLATYRDSDDASFQGIQIIRTDSEARWYQVTDGSTQFRIYAAVHPMADPAGSAEVLAEIKDALGNPYSFVLWHPSERRVVVPFDPQSAVDALRFERYVPREEKTALPQGLLSAYYAFKPLLPRGVKIGLRRLLARRKAPAEHFLSWPSDHSLDLLMRLLLRITMVALGRDTLPFLWFWPDEHPWAAILTHDVETAHGLSRVPHVMELERGKGLRSSFNLVLRDYEASGSQLAEMRESGFEIGVHGYRHDGLMFSSWQTFLERVVAVNEAARQWGAVGFRSPATYRNLEWFHLLGFEYDSSVADTAPYEPQPGGCGSWFPYFVGNILEVPMTMPQDHTLFGLLGHQDGGVWSAKLAEIRDSNGMACVLTHPDPGEGYIGRPENESRYSELLNLIAESDAWTPLPRDLARWWRLRAATSAETCQHLGGACVATAVIDAEGALRIVAPDTV